MREFIRLIFAGLFVWFGVIIALLGFTLILNGNRFPRFFEWLIGLVIGCWMLFLCGVAVRWFNESGYDWFGGHHHNEYVKGLEEKGLLEAQSYKATRAFQVEQFEFDEGSQYFLELEDKSVLFLCGQYLWDYEGIEDDTNLNTNRQFPCTEFTIRRHRQTKDSVDILCQGSVIEPEAIAPPFTDKDFDQKLVPEDGQIIRDRSYDQIKAERIRS